MIKKESDNMKNNTNEPNKDIPNDYDCDHPNSRCLNKISEYVEIFDPADDDVYVTCVQDIPYFIQVPIDPELQNLGIEDMALFEGKLTFKTKYGVVVLVKDDTAFQLLLLPTQKQSREHLIELEQTTRLLLISHVFKSSLKERMIG